MREPHANPQVTAAAQWLAEQKEPPSQAVPTIRQRFELSALEACDACKLALDFRLVRKVFG